MSIYDPSLQMSFIAVMAMSLVAPYIKRFHDGVFTGSLAVQAGLLPYIAYTFNCIPLAAFLINIPLIALTGIIVPLGVCCLVMDSLSEGIPAAHELLSALIAILVKGNSLTCIDGRTTFLCRSPSPFLIAAFYLSLLVIFSENGRVLMARYGHRFLVLSITAVFCCSCIYAASMKTGFEKADLVFVDVGQGDCMHMKIDDSARLLFRDDVYHVLIDGGGRENYSVGEKTLKPYLLKNGTKKIDLALVTHLHTDHYDGIRTLCRMGMVRKLCIYEGYKVREEQILAECALKREDIVYVTAGDVIDLGGRRLEVYEMPGHTKGSIVLVDRDAKICFSGDSIIENLWLFLEESEEPAVYLESLKRIREVLISAGIEKIYNGHFSYEPINVKKLDDMVEAMELILAGKLEGKAVENHAGKGIEYSHKDWKVILPDKKA